MEINQLFNNEWMDEKANYLYTIEYDAVESKDEIM